MMKRRDSSAKNVKFNEHSNKSNSDKHLFKLNSQGKLEVEDALKIKDSDSEIEESNSVSSLESVSDYDNMTMDQNSRYEASTKTMESKTP